MAEPFDFVFETVEPVELAPEAEEEPQTEFAFQLFSQQPATVSLAAVAEPERAKRPSSYYFAAFSPEQVASFSIAVEGSQVLANAPNFGYTTASTAPDINADFKPRKKCRPGKNARQTKLKKRQREDEEKKLAQKRKQDYFHRKKRNMFVFK